jgi:hypothetical protein
VYTKRSNLIFLLQFPIVGTKYIRFILFAAFVCMCVFASQVSKNPHVKLVRQSFESNGNCISHINLQLLLLFIILQILQIFQLLLVGLNAILCNLISVVAIVLAPGSCWKGGSNCVQSILLERQSKRIILSWHLSSRHSRENVQHSTMENNL